jgi:hypothetical protein
MDVVSGYRKQSPCQGEESFCIAGMMPYDVTFV